MDGACLEHRTGLTRQRSVVLVRWTAGPVAGGVDRLAEDEYASREVAIQDRCDLATPVILSDLLGRLTFGAHPARYQIWRWRNGGCGNH